VGREAELVERVARGELGGPVDDGQQPAERRVDPATQVLDGRAPLQREAARGHERVDHGLVGRPLLLGRGVARGDDELRELSEQVPDLAVVLLLAQLRKGVRRKGADAQRAERIGIFRRPLAEV
jgi:hypothetical protein